MIIRVLPNGCQIASNRDPPFASNNDPLGVRESGVGIVQQSDENVPLLAQRREGVARPEVRQQRRAFAKGPVWRRRLCTGMAPRNLLRSLGSGTVLEPPARVAGLDDVAVVRQPIEHG